MDELEKKIEFVYPTKTSEVSVTGKECALMCSHCKGTFLRDIERKDAKSCLVTGGCNRMGEVPLAENIDTLQKLSRRFKLIVHTGLIREETVKMISPFVLAVSFNLICDEETIHEVYHLDRKVEDFEESYIVLCKHVRVFPHITIGLYKGKISGEKKAIEFLESIGAEAVVFNILVPAPSTDYAKLEPPSLRDVTSILEEAKERLDSSIFLGCMRPGGEYRRRIDMAAIQLGIDRIVMPSRDVVTFAEKNRFIIGRREECCII
ncbi:MAG: radical SAM protein [Thermoproteota archaeon]